MNNAEQMPPDLARAYERWYKDLWDKSYDAGWKAAIHTLNVRVEMMHPKYPIPKRIPPLPRNRSLVVIL